MNIEWQDSGEPKWKVEGDKEKFIKKFETEIWPSYYELIDKQIINALAVNTYITLTNSINTRIDFEIEQGDKEKCIRIDVYPWVCVHSPEHIVERFKKDEDDAPWLTGRCIKKHGD